MQCGLCFFMALLKNVVHSPPRRRYPLQEVFIGSFPQEASIWTTHAFWSIWMHLFFVRLDGIDETSAFAARRGYCLRMALRRNGRLIFLDHRENGNGQQWVRYFHFVLSTQRRKFSLKQSATKRSHR